MQFQEIFTRPASNPADYLTNPTIMLDAERLLAGRTRDIRLTGVIGQAYRDRAWRQAAKIIRAWMVWVIVLDFLMLSINIVLLPPAVAMSMIGPGATIPVAAAAIYFIWRERRSDQFLGWSINVGMFFILLAVCFMGVAAGGPWHERYLNVMVFVAIAGITTFSIPMHQTWGIAASSLALYLMFQLRNPLVAPQEAFSTFFFFASGVTAVVVARRTMSILAKKAFLLELRGGARLSALAQANERLARLSKVDPLTGVANRRWMSEILTELASLPADMRGDTAMLMCDIDHFKCLNDRLGHAEGDRCLVEVAGIIQAYVQTGNACVARYGGEEFLVILQNTSGEDALQVAEGIRSAVAQAASPHPGSVVSWGITVSIGVSVRTGDQDWTPDELQWEADSALYLAKDGGRNRVSLFIPSTEVPSRHFRGTVTRAG